MKPKFKLTDKAERVINRWLQNGRNEDFRPFLAVVRITVDNDGRPIVTLGFGSEIEPLEGEASE